MIGMNKKNMLENTPENAAENFVKIFRMLEGDRNHIPIIRIGNSTTVVDVENDYKKRIEEAKKMVGPLQKENSALSKLVKEYESQIQEYKNQIQEYKDTINTMQEEIDVRIANDSRYKNLDI
jgi:predicted nuclease with TOPRIM domain